MRIKELGLVAFGLFSDYRIDLAGNRGLTLIYGLNEAGKSTVLRAIQDFLYGIPLRSPDAYFHPAGDLRIQAVLETAAGGELKLARRKGKKNTLLDEEGLPVEEDVLRRLLGSIDREAYALMFGMNHHSLRRGGEELLRGKGALGEALFEAASGMGGMRELFQELEQEAGDLFKPAGTRPPMNANIREYNEAKKKVAELSLAPRKWRELEEEYLEQKKKVEQLRELERSLNRDRTRIVRLMKTLPLAARRDENMEEITLLGRLPLLAQDFREKYQELSGKRSDAVRDLEKAEEEKRSLEADLGTIIIPEGLLEHAGEISALQERLDTYRNCRKRVPALEGEITGLEHEAAVLLRRVKPSCPSLEEAESMRLPLAAVEEINHLAESYPLLAQELAVRQDRIRELQRELEEQAAERAKYGPRKDAGGLSKALNRARKRGSLEGELKRVRTEMADREQGLTAALGALGLYKGTLQQLPALPLPLMETVRKFETNFKALQDRLHWIDEHMAGEESKLAGYREQPAGEKQGGEVGEEGLEEARKVRQYGWHLVRRAWLEGKRDEQEEQSFCGGHPLHLAYERAVVRADSLADMLRREAGRAERGTILQEEINRCRERMERLTAEKKAKIEEKEELARQWAAAWEKCGITPLTPPEMLTWLQRCREILGGLEQLSESGRRERELVQAAAAHREEVHRELLKLGEAGAEDGETLEALLDRAQGISEKYIDAAGRLQSAAEAHRKTEKELESARRQGGEAEKALVDWQNKWSRSMAAAGLPGETAAKAAAAYLRQLEELFQKKEELERRRIDRDESKRYMADFEGRLQKLAAGLAPDLLEMPADHAAAQLQERVNGALRSRERRVSLQGQIERTEKTLRGSKKALAEAESGIGELLRQAQCPAERDLPEVIEKRERQKELRRELDSLEKQLLDHGGGLSLEQIAEESRGVDGDALPGRLEEIEQRLKENRAAQDELNRTFGVTENRYREKIGGSGMEALERAEEAQGLLARLRVQTEEYLRLRLASMVLRRSIDRYREENQSPVIRLAGQLFARLTGGSFSGLEIDFDEKDNPVLQGLRSAKRKVAVEGMSDGTLDQLYLSLRLASLERYLEQNEPLPFILDDLLVNFDDPRAAETLKVLDEFADRTQVLFFTHHRSLAELARKAAPRSKTITLDREQREMNLFPDTP